MKLKFFCILTATLSGLSIFLSNCGRKELDSKELFQNKRSAVFIIGFNQNKPVRLYDYSNNKEHMVKSGTPVEKIRFSYNGPIMVAGEFKLPDGGKGSTHPKFIGKKYQVINVKSNDTLNIREGKSIRYGIVEKVKNKDILFINLDSIQKLYKSKCCNWKTDWFKAHTLSGREGYVNCYYVNVVTSCKDAGTSSSKNNYIVGKLTGIHPFEADLTFEFKDDSGNTWSFIHGMGSKIAEEYQHDLKVGKKYKVWFKTILQTNDFIGDGSKSKVKKITKVEAYN